MGRGWCQSEGRTRWKVGVESFRCVEALDPTFDPQDHAESRDVACKSPEGPVKHPASHACLPWILISAWLSPEYSPVIPHTP